MKKFWKFLLVTHIYHNKINGYSTYQTFLSVYMMRACTNVEHVVCILSINSCELTL